MKALSHEDFISSDLQMDRGQSKTHVAKSVQWSHSIAYSGPTPLLPKSIAGIHTKKSHRADAANLCMCFGHSIECLM